MPPRRAGCAASALLLAVRAEAAAAPAVSSEVVLVLGLGILLLVAASVVLLIVITRARAAAREERVLEAQGPPVLPGRFLVEEGDHEVEVRLRSTADGGREETTIGRDPGPPWRHLQLKVASVSVKHAKLVCEDGGWTITNYSRTNPTRVNGEELPLNASRRLVDGDRIELGEVAMTYLEA